MCLRWFFRVFTSKKLFFVLFFPLSWKYTAWMHRLLITITKRERERTRGQEGTTDSRIVVELIVNANALRTMKASTASQANRKERKKTKFMSVTVDRRIYIKLIRKNCTQYRWFHLLHHFFMCVLSIYLSMPFSVTTEQEKELTTCRLYVFRLAALCVVIF